jgi:hypothetical protein
MTQTTREDWLRTLQLLKDKQEKVAAERDAILRDPGNKLPYLFSHFNHLCGRVDGLAYAIGAVSTLLR